jgi:predicted anti-sigma-YlaC factor YlaD
VQCDECREILSARLDGEDRAGEAAAADAHVANCDACAQWGEDAATVTRLVRLASVPAPVATSDQLDPDRLDPERLAAAAPGPNQRRLAMILRWALGLLGMVQFLLGIAQVSLMADAGHRHDLGVNPAHLWHESAAWNIAVGAGFGWIALRRTSPHALLPLLTAFVAMLVLLSANDALVGTVDGARLVSHAFVVAGYLVLVALSRPRFDFGDPPAQRQPRPTAPVPGDGRAPQPSRAARPPLRLVTRAQPALSVLRPSASRVAVLRWSASRSAVLRLSGSGSAVLRSSASRSAVRWDRAA